MLVFRYRREDMCHRVDERVCAKEGGVEHSDVLLMFAAAVVLLAAGLAVVGEVHVAVVAEELGHGEGVGGGVERPRALVG